MHQSQYQKTTHTRRRRRRRRVKHAELYISPQKEHNTEILQKADTQNYIHGKARDIPLVMSSVYIHNFIHRSSAPHTLSNAGTFFLSIIFT